MHHPWSIIQWSATKRGVPVHTLVSCVPSTPGRNLLEVGGLSGSWFMYSQGPEYFQAHSRHQLTDWSVFLFLLCNLLLLLEHHHHTTKILKFNFFLPERSSPTNKIVFSHCLLWGVKANGLLKGNITGAGVVDVYFSPRLFYSSKAECVSLCFVLEKAFVQFFYWIQSKENSKEKDKEQLLKLKRDARGGQPSFFLPIKYDVGCRFLFVPILYQVEGVLLYF